MNYRKMLLRTMACALLLGPTPTQAALNVGDTLPDLGAFGLVGSLPSIKDKVVLIDFCASWCAPCQQSFPILDQLYRDNRAKGFELIAVSVDERKDALDVFLSRYSVNFTVVHDATRRFAEKADIETMPTSFLVDMKGKIVSVHKGFKKGSTEKLLQEEIGKLLP